MDRVQAARRRRPRHVGARQVRLWRSRSGGVLVLLRRFRGLVHRGGQVQAVRRRPSRREDRQSRVALRLGQHPARVAPVRALRHRGGVEVAAAPRRFHHEPELAEAGRREGRRRGRRVRDGAGHRAIHSQRARRVRGGAREEDPRVRGRLRRHAHGRGGGGVGDGQRSRQARRGRVAGVRRRARRGGRDAGRLRADGGQRRRRGVPSAVRYCRSGEGALEAREARG
mmetsp:Transcript_10350/g.42856  ORF Transcript_10350/g.42856 Transcript_10350/m.42856 type:complete len:226 (-) Transcript_10350:1578-2255(-)